MNSLKFLSAIALGCLIGHAVIDLKAEGQGQGGNIHVCADRDGTMRLAAPAAACPNGERSLFLKLAGDADMDEDNPKGAERGDASQADSARLEQLRRRLAKLEAMNCAALGKSRVVAPFEVVDRGGKRIFVVDKNEVKVFNSGGRAVAVITADPEGGFFTASGGAGTVFFGVADPHTFPVTGLGITDNGVVRVTLGQNSDLGNFSLKFRGPSGRSVAAIGVSPDTNAGLALVNDAAGNRKAGIGVTKDGTGSVEVSSGNGRTIAQLTQGEHRGGKLLICSAASCDPPMVAAGDAGGYGVVATGPMYFNTGAGMLGAVPGSYIIGKK